MRRHAGWRSPGRLGADGDGADREAGTPPCAAGTERTASLLEGVAAWIREAYAEGITGATGPKGQRLATPMGGESALAL